jgi:hypothetical protein
MIFDDKDVKAQWHSRPVNGKKHFSAPTGLRN